MTLLQVDEITEEKKKSRFPGILREEDRKWNGNMEEAPVWVAKSHLHQSFSCIPVDVGDIEEVSPMLTHWF